MKMRNKIRTILAISLIAIFLLTGCRIFKKDVHTVLTLTNAALTNVAEVESAEVKIRGDGDLNATYEALNIGLNMKLGTDLDLEMTKNPERTKGTAEIKIGAIGQEQVIKGRIYKDTAEDGTKTTYVQWQEGDWLKRTTAPAEETSEKKGFTVPTSLIQTVGIMKAIADGDISAELQEETVMINDKEAWQMDFVVTGEFLRQILDKGGFSLGGLTIETADVDWESLEVPAQIYIYKETELPARITMDCTPIGAQMIESMFTDYMESLSLEGIKLKVTSYTLDITLDKYNEIETFEIPAEAAGAAETDSLMPSLEDVLKFW
jgi:hypothetical protein